jgi:hypothetical protein
VVDLVHVNITVVNEIQLVIFQVMDATNIQAMQGSMAGTFRLFL